MTHHEHHYAALTIAYKDPVATVTLNRPEKRDAISRELIEEIHHALHEVQKSSAHIMILTGAGAAFTSSAAKFGYTEVRIGFVPAIVSTFLLRQVGEKQARDLVLTWRIIDADEAFRIGLVNAVVTPEKLLARVEELAETLAANSPASLLATKRLLRTFSHVELDRQVSAAVDENARIRTTSGKVGLRSWKNVNPIGQGGRP